MKSEGGRGWGVTPDTLVRGCTRCWTDKQRWHWKRSTWKIWRWRAERKWSSENSMRCSLTTLRRTEWEAFGLKTVQNETTEAFTQGVRGSFYPVAERKRQHPVRGTREFDTSWLSFGKFGSSHPQHAEAGMLPWCAQPSVRLFPDRRSHGTSAVGESEKSIETRSKIRRWWWMRKLNMRLRTKSQEWKRSRRVTRSKCLPHGAKRGRPLKRNWHLAYDQQEPPSLKSSLASAHQWRIWLGWQAGPDALPVPRLDIPVGTVQNRKRQVIRPNRAGAPVSEQPLAATTCTAAPEPCAIQAWTWRSGEVRSKGTLAETVQRVSRLRRRRPKAIRGVQRLWSKKTRKKPTPVFKDLRVGPPPLDPVREKNKDMKKMKKWK